MGGTKIGGRKALKTNKAKYGKDFYRRIGRMGGLAPKTKPGGFTDRELASRAGKLGGLARGYKRRMNNV